MPVCKFADSSVEFGARLSHHSHGVRRASLQVGDTTTPSLSLSVHAAKYHKTREYVCVYPSLVWNREGRVGAYTTAPPGTIFSGTGRKHTSDIYTPFSFFQYHRAANRSTPIVAVAPPRLFQASPPPLAQKYFNENLQFPVPARKVRGLATRWLLPPPSCSGAAAPSGMVGELDPGLTAWAAAAGHAAGGGGCISGGSTITPTSVPSSLPGGGFPSQQQQGGGGGVECPVLQFFRGCGWRRGAAGFRQVPAAAKEGERLSTLGLSKQL